jgi:acyl-CoA thioester hydrolase
MICEEVEVEIAFHDVDVLCVAWHGNYARYFELARTALVRKIGIDWPVLQQMDIAAPVVNFSCTYKKPLLYGQRYAVRVTLSEPFSPKVVLEYSIVSVEDGSERACASTEQVYVDLKTHEIQFVVPDRVREAMQRAVDGEEGWGHAAATKTPQAVWGR